MIYRAREKNWNVSTLHTNMVLPQKLLQWISFLEQWDEVPTRWRQDIRPMNEVCEMPGHTHELSSLWQYTRACSGLWNRLYSYSLPLELPSMTSILRFFDRWKKRHRHFWYSEQFPVHSLASTFFPVLVVTPFFWNHQGYLELDLRHWDLLNVPKKIKWRILI